MVIARIISGGQTGADRAALDVAVALGIPYDGWCPRGGWAEDVAGLLVRYPGLHETASDDPAERTRLNVRDSDATLVVRGAGVRSPGTDATVEWAARLGRPWLESTDTGEVLAWLDGLPSGLALNVAGPRASEDPAAYDVARALLERVLRPGSHPQPDTP